MELGILRANRKWNNREGNSCDKKWIELLQEIATNLNMCVPCTLTRNFKTM